MNSKLLLIAASTLALAACGGSDVETAEADIEATNESGVGTLLSEEQPRLEGDSPFVDGQDVADSTLTEQSYDTGLDGPDLTDDGYDAAAVASADEDFGASADSLIARSERAAGDARADLDAAGTQVAANAAGVADAVTDGTSAKRFTADNTDAYVADDGELITGSEAALLAGTYEVAMPGVEGTKMLYVTGEGDKAIGTFDGEPIEVMVTGRNFSFDAPVAMDGGSQLMTFAGTFEDGVIDNGVLESQGDGTTMTFTAVRTDADTDMTAREMLDDAASDTMSGAENVRDRMMRDGETMLDEAGDAAEGAYDETTNAIGGSFDRATDGSDDTNMLGTDRGDGDVDLDIDEDLDAGTETDPNFDM